MNRRLFLQYLPAFSSVPLLLPTINRSALWSQDEPDAAICSRKFEIAIAQSWEAKPIGELIVEIGRSFIGTDYLANGIEAPGNEHLIVNMRGLDCVSFCENVIVLARCIKKQTTTFEDYKRELQFIRYRGGVIDQYPSRLHYFTDYLFDGEKKGVWANVTNEVGGKPYRKQINFMSTHPQSYRQLKEHDEFVKVIEQQEIAISKRPINFVPKSAVASLERKIRNGDILAITTEIEGLDVSHTGVAVWNKERLHMMHAPDVGYKVTMTELPLADYLAKNRRQSGIIVARAREPRPGK